MFLSSFFMYVNYFATAHKLTQKCFYFIIIFNTSQLNFKKIKLMPLYFNDCLVNYPYLFKNVAFN